MNKRTSLLLTAVRTLALALFLLSAAIAAPILCRPFYYVHIPLLHLTQTTGLTGEEIRTAYNEMLDFCLGLGTFSTGVLPWSERGRSHFQDVQSLFLLDLRLCIGALLVLVLCVGISRLTGCREARPLGRGSTFWAGCGLGGGCLLMGGLAALNFNRAFALFHQLFFPGKDNWIFDPDTDAIINILPQVFFRNCAILILAILLLGCIGFVRFDAHRRFPKRE